ncbi:exodeoxyribonuclease VII small subunit [Haloferula luteola]|uniref:Exodeoxyribonuclease 7 small subunit n=1 Tax=Haloferula luteola TaxID=595692 RepID=A0A840VBA6_9BACT|nr:exodeoxyribonuclease VII small subunit [Haloferula luteola]MBB5351220.1 exodeoxyribonuclease VII small subunit [Haloferula luteola]
MPARKKAEPENLSEPSFEDALSELEAIVQSMEEEQLPLEQLVSRYEKGVKLLDRCQTVLQGARERLQTISQQASNPLTPDEDVTNESSDDDPDDDIRLF